MVGVSRLKACFDKEAKETLMRRFQYTSPMQMPRLDKIVINVGVGEATQNSKAIESVVQDIATITGQQPVVTKAKRSIASFKLREGMPVGVKVTLRGKKRDHFFDRLVNVALPRMRDFRGLPTRSFDGHGNYSLGLKEQLIFPEIEYDSIDKVRGMDIIIVTTAKSDEEAHVLLSSLGMPFKPDQKSSTASSVS